MGRLLGRPARPRGGAVAERGRRVGEHTVARARRVRHRLRKGPLGLALELLADRLVDGVDVDAGGAYLLLVALDRIAARPELEHLLGYVAHVVVRAMAVHPHGHALDQRPPATGPRTLAGLGGRLEHGLHVVAVDLHAGEAVAR